MLAWHFKSVRYQTFFLQYRTHLFIYPACWIFELTGRDGATVFPFPKNYRLI